MNRKQNYPAITHNQRQSSWLLGLGIVAFVIALYGLILATLSLQAAAGQPTGDNRVRGLLVARPAGVAGEWKVGTQTFIASAATEIKVENGPLEIGACTEVEFHDAKQADFIRSLPALECNEATTTTPAPSTTASPSPSATTGTPGTEQEARGLVETMPANLIGTWVINGVSYLTTASTEFKQENGPFAIGSCVKVHYAIGSTPAVVREIETKLAGDCSQSGTPNATGTPAATTSPGDERKVMGQIEAMPEVGLWGEWSISGVKYNATASARLRQEDGPFVPSACVEVRYTGQAAPFTVTELRTEEAEKCSDDATSTPVGPTPSETPTPNGDELEVYGRVNSFPANLVGSWVVSNTTYTATAATEFKQERGAFAVSVCVKIHTTTRSAPFTIRELETTQDFRCTGNAPGVAPQSELFGMLQSFPPNLIGDWNIGGQTFVADATTQFKQEQGAFSVGMTVKVHFVAGADGVLRAQEIESKFANDNNGQDNNRNGAHDGREGHAYGRIETFPAALTGAWRIGGVDYTAESSTLFKQEGSPFAQGTNVWVKFYLDANRQRIAREIRVTDYRGGVVNANRELFVGYIHKMPASGFVGEWVVSNVGVIANAATVFKETNGLLGLGAYVTLEYQSINGVNTLIEIETRVPPGAGTTNMCVTRLESVLGTITPWVEASATVNRTWRLDGVDYVITAATDLNEISGAFAIGNAVLVNSYTAADGSQVATRVQSVELKESVYLPLARR